MLLGKSAILGASTLQTAIPPLETGFDFLAMCGTFTVDELNGLNVLLNETQVFDLVTEQDFGNMTMFLGHFEDNLNLGNFQGGLPVTNWNILRRKTGETNFTLLATLPNTSVSQYLDIRAVSGQAYEYAVQSVSNGVAGQVLISEEVNMNFWGWSLSSLDFNEETNTGTQFIFNVEINTDSVKLNVARTQFDNFARYPKISRGVRRFESGRLTTFPLTCNNNNIQEPNNATLNLLKAFIEDGNEKILKNGSGQQWRVDTTDFDTKYRDRLTNTMTTNRNEQPYDITFSWVEVAEVVGS